MKGGVKVCCGRPGQEGRLLFTTMSPLSPRSQAFLSAAFSSVLSCLSLPRGLLLPFVFNIEAPDTSYTEDRSVFFLLWHHTIQAERGSFHKARRFNKQLKAGHRLLEFHFPKDFLPQKHIQMKKQSSNCRSYTTPTSVWKFCLALFSQIFIAFF